MAERAVDNNNNQTHKTGQAAGKTIDLQGVAAFAGLVEVLGQELGTTPGRIQGLLPNGPATFEQLVGEILINSQGFQRSLILQAEPGSSLKLRFHCAWRDTMETDEAGATISGIEAHFFLDATVEQILPQGRALARYVEDVFGILDSMVTLGQSGRLSAMSVSASEIEAFEQNQAGNLVNNFSPKRSGTFELKD